MKSRKTAGPVARVKSAPRHSIDTDVSEAFRRARSSIAKITTDLDGLRRRTTSAVKSTQRSK